MKKFLFFLTLIIIPQITFGQRIYSVVFDNLPQDNQLYPRNDKNEAIVSISGQIELANWKYLSVIVLRNKIFYQYQRSEIKYNAKGDLGTFDLKPLIKSELAEYDFQIYASQLGKDSVLMVERKNIVAGDYFLISGQSNAVAFGVGYLPYTFTNKYCRTFGLPKFGKQYTQSDTTWAVSDYTVGAWGLGIQKLILEKYNIPTCVINGGVPGTQIDFHQRNDLNKMDLGTIYGRLLYRTQKAKVIDKVKAFFFWQGENDIFENEPALWAEKFDKLFNSWRQDYSLISKFYVFQINIVAFKKYESGNQRDYQRRIKDIYAPFVESIATVGNFGYDGAHYSNEGYLQFASECVKKIERDFYGVKPTTNISSPNIRKAFYTSFQKNEIALVFDEGQEMVWKSDTILQSNDGLNMTQSASQFFFIDKKSGLIASGRADKNKIIISLKVTSDAKKITYLPPYFPFDDTEKRKIFGGPFLQNINQMKALTFQDLAIDETDFIQPIKISTPIMQAINITFNSVMLSWKSVDGANKFILEKIDSTLNFKILATLSNAQLFYNDNDLNENTNYSYRLRAENLNSVSDYFKVSIKTPALLRKPELSSTILYYNSLKINWKSIDGAITYKVERKSDNEDYKQIAILDSKSLEWIDKDLLENTLYTYRVKALGDKTESLENVISVQTPAILSTPELTVETITHENVKLKWKLVTNANKYLLERLSPGEIVFQKIFETDNLLEYSDVKLKENTAYLYRLKALSSISESGYAKIDLKTMTILSTQSEEDTWFKVFPNPVSEQLSISFTIPISGNVSFVNLLGKVVFEQQIAKQKSLVINVSTFKKGFYLVLIKTNQELYSQKVIIE